MCICVRVSVSNLLFNGHYYYVYQLISKHCVPNFISSKINV